MKKLERIRSELMKKREKLSVLEKEIKELEEMQMQQETLEIKGIMVAQCMTLEEVIAAVRQAKLVKKEVSLNEEVQIHTPEVDA